MNLLDPFNLIKTSGITEAHNPEHIKKPILMEPPSKTLQASFGVSYREPKIAIDGEPYENQPSEKKRMTRSQFIELSQTVIRDNQSVSLDGDFSKILNHQDSMETTIAMTGNNQFSVEKFTNVFDSSQ